MGFSSIPLAFLAGMLGLLSPCVLPMLPAVIASATRSSKMGLLFLAGGLSLSLALAGTLLSYLLLNAGLSPQLLREITAVILAIMGIILTFHRLSDVFSAGLSRLVSHFPALSPRDDGSLIAQFLIGISLGLVWLPCVGPTIGTAIALASQGQDMTMAFTVMLAYGIGTALPLMLVGGLARQSLNRLSNSAQLARKLIGISLLLLGVSIMTGFDHWLEALAMNWLPEWALDI